MAHTTSLFSAGTLLVIGLGTTTAQAAGSVHHLDPGFAAGGVASLAGATIFDVVRQSDGSIVVAGESSSKFFLARYSQAGVLDSTFGDNGTVHVTVSADPAGIAAVVAMPDDRIVAVGTVRGDEEELAVVRLEPDGTLDAGFASGGIFVEEIGVEPYDAALQVDGAIVVAGYVDAPPTNSQTTAVALTRLDAAGDIDATFGTAGVVQVRPLSNARLQEAWSVAIQGDGKIVTAGVGGNTVLDQDFLTLRFNGDGSLDGTFGDGGAVRTSPSDFQDIAYDVAIQADGKIVVVGGQYPAPNRLGFGVVRYLSDGTLDASFDGDGIVQTAFSVPRSNDATADIGGYYGAYARAVQLASDGRIVVAGESLLARYNPDGTLDDTFGGGTIATLLPDGSVPSYWAVAVQPDGKVIAAGATYAGGQNREPGIIARYAPCACAPCEACDADGACVIAPPTGCFAATTSSLKIRDSLADATDAFGWKWSAGTQVPAEALGLPYETTDYALCVYDESAGPPAVVLAASLPAGAACVGAHCWNTSIHEDSAKFKDRNAAVGGIGSAGMKSGEEPSVRAKGKGAALNLSSVPMATPVRVQLQAENGACWEAVYQASDVVRAAGGQFIAVE